MCFQYNRHGLDWHDGNLSLGKALKAISKRVKPEDKVIIKGFQKVSFFIGRSIISTEQVVPVEESPTLKQLIENFDKKCATHENMCNKRV